MPALFAYIVALVILIGAGYEGLQWLAEPLPATNHDQASHAKASAKSKIAAEKAEAHPDADRTPASDPEPGSSNAPREPTRQATAETRSDNNEASKTAEQAPAPAAGDVPRGGCMPIGITERGKLVFPMACEPILSQKRDSQTIPQPDSAESAPAAKQAQTAVDREVNPAPKPKDPAATGSTASNANDRIENGPTNAHAVKPDEERADHDVGKRKRTAEREPRSSQPKGVMMILRTIEFPDGHREQRLLSMNQWRRSAYQDERW